MPRSVYSPNYRVYQPLPTGAQAAQGIAGAVNRFLDRRRQEILDQREEERQRAISAYQLLVTKPELFGKEESKLISRAAKMPEPQVEKLHKESMRYQEKQAAYKREMDRERMRADVIDRELEQQRFEDKLAFEREKEKTRAGEAAEKLVFEKEKEKNDQLEKIQGEAGTKTVTFEDFKKWRDSLIKHFLPTKQVEWKQTPTGLTQEKPSYTAQEYDQAEQIAGQQLLDELRRYGKSVPDEWVYDKQPARIIRGQPEENRPTKKKAKKKDPVAEILKLLEGL